MRLLFLTLLLSFYSVNLASQAFADPFLNQAFSEADIISKGKITNSHSYNSEDGKIYTDYQVRFLKVYKGAISDTSFTFTRFGGEVNGTIQFRTHQRTFHKGQTGLFLLNKENSLAESDSKSYQLLENEYGFLEINVKDLKKVINLPSSKTVRYKSIEDQLFLKYRKTGTNSKSWLCSK